MLKEGRVLLPNIQHRVMVGIASFVGMLLLVGWVAINEPARMDVFTQQYQGRSIENGASTFVNNCAICHGVDGRGIEGRAPGLNNPMLFIKDNPAKTAAKKISDLQAQSSAIQGDITAYQQNVLAFQDARKKLDTVAPGSEDEQKLKTQITSLTAQIQNFDLIGTQKKIDDLIAQVNDAQADLTKLQAQGWDPTRDSRLTEVKWGGTLQGYLESTVISGRPVSALYWPQPMPAWGQQAGGPMRPDEIRDVVAYILNFQDAAVKLTPNDVHQQFKLPGGAVVKANPVGINADVNKLAANDALKGGDTAAGEALYKGALGCAGCHLAGAAAPKTEGTYTRILNERLKDPANAGKTPEEYIAESIIHPNTYVSPGFTAGVMPQNFGDQIDVTDLKNLVAFLESQK